MVTKNLYLTYEQRTNNWLSDHCCVENTDIVEDLEESLIE